MSKSLPESLLQDHDSITSNISPDAVTELGRFGAWAYDVDTARLIWSDEVRAIHEVDADYVPDIATAINFYHPDYRERIARLFASCVAEGEGFDETFVLVSAAGRERHVRSMGHALCDEKGRVVRIEGAFHDLTELLARNRRLAQSEATLKAVFSQSYMYQGVLDAEGRLAMANDIAFDACGYRREEEVGRYFWECGWWNADAVVMEEVRAIVQRAFAGETVSADLDYFVASGERRRTQFAAVPIRVNGGHEKRVLVSGMDVTVIKRNEAFHIRLRQVLEQIAARRPLADSLLSILVLIETLFPKKRASINLLSADGLRLAHGYSPHLPPDYMRLLEGLPIGPRAGSCGTAAYERSTVIVEDIATDPRWDDYRELAEVHNLRSCWSLPIFNVQDRVLGTFAIYDTEPATPLPGELELVADCAHIAGIAIERAQAEAQLHLLDSCIARLNDVLMITEAEPLTEPGPRMLFVNEAFTRLTGYSAAEVLGKTPRILQGPNTQRDELERIRNALRTRQPVRAELLNYRKSGEEYWVEVEIVPIPDADGKIRHLAAIERDISERKQAEQQLLHSEQRFHYIARATSDTIWDWDLQSNTIWWSEGLVRLFGYAEEIADPSAQAWIERIHPDDQSRIEAGIHNFIAHGSEDDTWSEEYRFRRADGSYAIVRDRGFVIRAADGSGVRMVGGMLDVSAQRAAEAEMQRLNRALQMLSACNEKLIRSSDENTLLRQICAICVNTGGYRMAWVGYAQRDSGSSLRPVAHFGDGGYLQRMVLSWAADKPSGNGPGGRTIREGKPVVVEDVENDASFEPWCADALAMGYRGVICLPLCNGDESFGLLGLYTDEVRTVSADELRLLQEMADDLAFGILGLRTRREQQRLQSAIFNIATSVSTRSSKSFFRDLLLTATSTLEASVGVIATLDLRHELCVRPICSVRDGVQIESASFSIHSTPCMESLSTQGRWIEGELAALYPEAHALHQYDPNACAYAGLPLLDSEGRPLGLLFLLFRNAPGSSDFVISTLKIFAARIAAELERQQAEGQLREQASLLDKAHDAILVRDLEHRVLFWNRGAERLYGWTAAEASGHAIDELLYEDTRAFKEGTRKVLQQGEWQGELLQRDKQGRQIWIEAHWSLVRDEAGQPRSILAINTDITQRKASEREIYTLAFHDGLTGLPNRQLFRNRLEQALLVAERNRDIGAVLFIDLDNFKALNDTQGHDVGDQLLIEAAARISHCLRESDTVARIGGDEFVVLLTDLGMQRSDAATSAQEIAEKIAHAFTAAFDLSGYEYSTSPSIGVVLFSDAESSVDELLKRADLAMYQAKAAGRNAIRFFDPEMQAAVTLRVQVEKDLRRALANRELVLYYQAQIDADGRLLGAEALIRWQHPQHGLLSPYSFIPIAEDCGLILSVGAWALDTACAQLATWSGLPGRRGMSISVNVSARQFRHPAFVVQVQETIERHRIDPHCLKLELTETQLLDNVEETIDKMHALGQLGVKLSLDDFGTGYSSLSYLRRLPLHQLKIDPSFVRDIATNPGDAAIARTIIALGQSLGLEVIAEGVETEAQRELLLGLGCECYQGYLFSRAIPIEQFEQLEFIPVDALR